MHSIETTVIMVIVIYFYFALITHVFKWEAQISKTINEKFNKTKVSYMERGDKDYFPENVTRIISSINQFLNKREENKNE